MMMRPSKMVVMAAMMVGTASAQDDTPEWVQPAADEAAGQICHLVYVTVAISCDWNGLFCALGGGGG